MVALSGVTPDATTATKGKIQLTGDLAGTAAVPLLGLSAIKGGYAAITTAFNSTTVGSYVDVTGLSITFTVPTGGRGVHLEAWFNASGGNGNMFVSILEGSTVLARTDIQGTTISGGVTMAYLTPSAGSHTYKVSIQQGSAGTMSLRADTTYPAFILAKFV